MNKLLLLSAVILLGALHGNSLSAEPAAQGGEAEFIQKIKEALNESGIMDDMNEDTAHSSY